MSYVLNDYSTDSPMHFKRTLSRFARLLLLLLLMALKCRRIAGAVINLLVGQASICLSLVIRPTV